VARADGTHARMVARSRGISACPSGFSAWWAPDSKRIAYAGYDRIHNIYLIHTINLDGNHNHVIGHGDRVSWSPNDTSIAFSNQGSVWIRTRGRTHLRTRVQFLVVTERALARVLHLRSSAGWILRYGRNRSLGRKQAAHGLG